MFFNIARILLEYTITLRRKKSISEEPEYHGRGDKSTITYYHLIIPVILQRCVGGSKVFPSDKIPE